MAKIINWKTKEIIIEDKNLTIKELAEKAYEKELNKGKKEKIYNLDPAKLHAIKQEVVKEKIYNLDPAAFTPIFKGASNE